MVLAIRTKRYYRDKSVFEQLADGTAVFNTLIAASYSKTLGLVILVLIGALSWTTAILMLGNADDNTAATLATWILVGVALVLTALAALRVGARVLSLFGRLLHRSEAVLVDASGVHQTGSRGDTVDLNWEDIRLIQDRRSVHLVRGSARNQRIEISVQLENHETISAFLKFAFLLRQEIGTEWRGLIPEVTERLNGPGFHFHYDGERTDTVYINSQGIKHSSAHGIESEMPWDLMRDSIFESHRDGLKFRHTGSRTSIVIPRGTDSDEIIEEFIRWALHTEPSFSSDAA